MTDENAMNNMNDTTAAVPPTPNGHGNGTTTGETHQAGEAAEGASKDASPSSKKKKKKKRHQHDKMPASVPAESIATATTDQAAPTEPAEPAEPADPQPPIEESAAPIEARAPASIEEPTAVPIEEPAAVPIEAPVAAAPIEARAENIRLRIKVWTDPATAKRYLMPSAFMRDVDANGQPMTDVMYAYALRADDIQRVTLTAGEWQALPFVYVQEDGPAPRTTARPVDTIASDVRTP